MTDLERATNYFKNDIFAMDTCGIQIKKPGENAECVMHLEKKHKNALDQVMGGAIFSLADFTLAVALNFDKDPSVTTSATINFLTTAKGDTLISRAAPIRVGRKLSYYKVDIYDNLENLVATVTLNGFRL